MVGVVSTSASQQEGHGFEPRSIPCPFCVEFACSLRVRLGFPPGAPIPTKDMYVRVNTPVSVCEALAIPIWSSKGYQLQISLWRINYCALSSNK